MRTFVLDLIPRILRYSHKLDTDVVLTKCHWVLVDTQLTEKVVYIFRERNNELLISKAGIVQRGKWENLGNGSLVIDAGGQSKLLKHGFIDDKVLALKLDGTNEYALFVSELVYDTIIKTVEGFIQYLLQRYQPTEVLEEPVKLTLAEKLKLANAEEQSTTVQPSKVSLDVKYPDYEERLKNLSEELRHFNEPNTAQIVIQYCRYHSINSELTKSNNILVKALLEGWLPIGFLESIFSDDEILDHDKSLVESRVIAQTFA